MVQQSSGRFGSIIKSDRSFYKVQEGLGRFKNVQEGSRRLKKVQEGSIRLKNAREGSKRFKKAPDSKRRIKMGQMFKNDKEEKIPKGLRVIIDSCFGWVVNQEGYGMIALFTD